MVMIWIESVVNRTPDGPSLDSATSPTASQAVLGAQIINWRPQGLARPFLANGKPRRTLTVGSNGQRDAPSQKGACQINKWQERDWGHLPLRCPAERASETRRIGGQADRRDCKISPTQSYKGPGGHRVLEGIPAAPAAASTFQALSPAAWAGVGKVQGPQRAIPTSTSPRTLQLSTSIHPQPGLALPVLSCTPPHHPPSSTTAVARSIFVPVGRPLLLSLVSP